MKITSLAGKALMNEPPGAADVAPKILIFAPYAAWKFHTNYEATIARACRLRGAEVRYLLCDGVMAECSMYSTTGWYPRGRPLDLCKTCQVSSSEAVQSFGFECEWMGQFVTEAERREVHEWAQSLSVDELGTACFRGLPIAEWIITSVVSYFRELPDVKSNWHHATVWRGFLQGSAFASIALTRILDEWRPDALLLFNGRLNALLVALQLAKARGIRALIHERPLQPGTLFLYENTPANSLEPLKEFASAWQDVALERDQLSASIQWLRDRRFPPDRELDLLYAKKPEGHTGKSRLAAEFGLDPGKKTWVLFTSSTDEFIGDPALQSPFDSQEQWIESILNWVAEQSEIQIIVRVHPNVGGEGLGGRAEAQYLYFKTLKESLADNAHLILPDENWSAYDLMDMADAGLTYGSTAGLEMLALGKPVLTVPPIAVYGKCPGVLYVTEASQLVPALSTLTEGLPVSPQETQRGAFRCIYRVFFHRQPAFPLVSAIDRERTSVNYNGDAALAPGRDSVLDRICEFLFTGARLFDDPTPAELARPQDHEDAVLKELGQSANWLRPPFTSNRMILRGRALRKGAKAAAKAQVRRLARVIKRVVRWD